MFAKTFLLTGLAYVASAHMLMSNPVPYGRSTLNNSPLEKDGSDFPCKMRGNTYESEGASNVYAQGSTQQLSFVGQAVHGGGSCQISITTDVAPNKNSVWKVIKSIEGGCPAKGQAGNMGESADAPDPYKYDFTIPKELAAGKYTLAWTWFNKVGNREMYMNCAPLEVTGSGGSKDHLDSLPNMFTANIDQKCGTLPDTDLVFPDPGSDVDRFNGATTAFSPPNQGCKDQTAAPRPTQATSPVASAPAQATPTKAPAKEIPGGVFITISEPADSQPPATTLVPVVTPSPVVSQAPVMTTVAPKPGNGSGGGSGDGSNPGSGSGGGSNPGSGSGDGSKPGSGSGGGSNPGNGSSNGGFAAGTACTTEGEWNCIAGTSFQRCASGAWSAPQVLSAGVTCTPGQSSDLNMSAKRANQVMRRSSRIRV